MNYSAIQNQVTSALSQLGQSAKVKHAAGGSSICNAVFGKIVGGDLDSNAAAMVTISYRTVYISVTKKEPMPGDILVIRGEEFGINNVEKYSPTNVVLAYLLEVDN